MALDKNDLLNIEAIVDNQLKLHLTPIKSDVAEMKKDIALLSSLNQLDEIRKDPRLRALYKAED